VSTAAFYAKIIKYVQLCCSSNTSGERPRTEGQMSRSKSRSRGQLCRSISVWLGPLFTSQCR